MQDDGPRKLKRETINRLLNALHALGKAPNSRDFEVDLFRLIDSRTVRKATGVRIDTIVSVAGVNLKQNNLEGPLRPSTFEAWVSETREVETSYFDESGIFTSNIGEYVELSPDGEYFPSSHLDHSPYFTSEISDALHLKWAVSENYLRFTISEIDGEWGTDYRVTLADRKGLAVSHYEADTLPHASVGAVLRGLVSGWTHEPARFEVAD